MFFARFSNIVCVCCLALSIVHADPPPFESGASGLYLQLKSLQSPVSVLHVVAHPDDEDGDMLAYCARRLGLRTMLFCLTRGEGGANLISNHFFDELGALRTLEHAKAASYYGNELFYSRAADYGYSKTLEEAMKKWDQGGPLLEQLVELIRRERPTILLSRFAGDARDGHGQHQMAGVLSRRAVEAAADPRQFPTQIQRGLQPYRVQKFYVRAGSPWRPPGPGTWTVALPVGSHDPVLGRSAAQIARDGLGYQRSQGFSGHLADPGPKETYYRREQGTSSDEVTREVSLTDGLDTSWSGLANAPDDPTRHESLMELDRRLAKALFDWDPRHPEETLKHLFAVRELLEGLEEPSTPTSPPMLRELERLAGQLSHAIARAAGIEVTSWATQVEDAPINFAVPGQRIRVTTRIANLGTFAVHVHRNDFHATAPEQVSGAPRQHSLHHEKVGSAIVAGDTLEISSVFALPADIDVTRPGWSRGDIAQSLYTLEAEGQLDTDGPRIHVTPTLDVLIQNQPQAVSCPAIVHVRRRDPVYGDVRYPLAIVPDKSVRFELDHRLVPQTQRVFETSVVVRTASQTNAMAKVRLELPPGWTATPATQEVTFQREDELRRVTFRVAIPEGAATQAFPIHAVVESAAGEFREGFETVTARDLDRINIYHDASQHIHVADIRVLGTPRVGYIAGSGDRVAESLAPLGIRPTLLSSTDLAASDLSDFDVILVGVRAYAVRDDVRTHNDRLLDYVKRGGVLIVQYQTPEFDRNFGPYPYTMGRSPEEVSEEDALVTVLRPQHPVFHTPNAITPEDFEGWFEQRGSKFWSSWDAKYTALLECHDRGQPPQQGGLLIAPYGDGVYVYSAYAWYRQLPRGVPGAYRLFANLLSLPGAHLDP